MATQPLTSKSLLTVRASVPKTDLAREWLLLIVWLMCWCCQCKGCKILRTRCTSQGLILYRVCSGGALDYFKINCTSGPEDLLLSLVEGSSRVVAVINLRVIYSHLSSSSGAAFRRLPKGCLFGKITTTDSPSLI